MRGIRETIEYRVECDGINRKNERCTNATPYFSDREFPHPLDPDVDAEAQANKWAVEHGWRWKRMYRNMDGGGSECIEILMIFLISALIVGK